MYPFRFFFRLESDPACLDEVEQWLDTSIGRPNYQMIIYITGVGIFLEREADALLVKIRFSEYLY